MIRILVTGSRYWTERSPMRGVLLIAQARLAVPADQVIVVHGAQGTKDRRTGRVMRGLDLIAAEQATLLGMGTEPHPADWDQHGKSAGPIRNGGMVALGAVWCLGFPLPGSVGTVDCMTRAQRAGMRVFSCSSGELVEVGGDVPALF